MHKEFLYTIHGDQSEISAFYIEEDGWASGIVMENEGRYIIVSNRKHDSITTFEINQDTGFLKYKDCKKTGGGQPRYIVVNPLTNRILAANETTDTLKEFEIDQTNGQISGCLMTIDTESPVCVIFGEV